MSGFRPPDLHHVPLPVIHEDPRFVVVDKPSGLLSVPAKDPGVTDHARARVAERYPHATGPLTVHRLDMETSGLLLVALDPEAQRDLSRQFQDRVVKKTYVALLAARPEGEEGEIALPLRADLARRPLQIVDQEKGRPATTRWRVLDAGPPSRVELRPATGRTHQLRVHCADPRGLGAPILGDRLYGDPASAPRLMLHARELVFEHPSTYAPVRVVAPEPF